MGRKLAVAPLLLGSLACGADSTSPADLEGTYQLVELNAQPLPYNPAGCCVYTAGSLSLEEMSYEIAIAVRNKTNGMVGTFGEQGSYLIQGAAIEFRPNGDDAPLHLFDAIVENNTIRLALGGDSPGAADQFRAVFRK